MKYYKFKNIIFNENGTRLRLYNENLEQSFNDRGGVSKCYIDIDMTTGDINLQRYKYEANYLDTTEVIKKLGNVFDLKEVTEEKAKEILSKPQTIENLRNLIKSNNQ